MRYRKCRFIGILLLSELLVVFLMVKFVLADQNSLLEIDGRLSRNMLRQTQCAVLIQRNHDRIIKDQSQLIKLVCLIEKIDVERCITVREKGKNGKAEHIIELKNQKNASTYILFDQDYGKVWIDFKGRSGYIYHIKNSHEIEKLFDL
jgi:hypothetical protein